MLNERAREVIRDYIASLGTIPPAGQFLFRSRTDANRPICRTQAHRLLKKLCHECDIDSARISTHSLRKSFVRAVYDASGHDLVRTQRIGQHQSPLTTALYLESTQSELNDLVLGLGAPAPAAAALHSFPLAS
ncbi:MAG: tyrosine-type recombinase/integrase [Opitutaceae bacterium]|nr:tyrosine-type recombinase/integrase [Opitutaceae bacterium]